MKILVGIPFLTGYKHSHEAISSVLNQPDIHLLIIDNGATDDLKELFKNYTHLPNVSIIHNEHNIYVNPAWNQIMKFFLQHPEFDILCIMNSDLRMQKNWSDVLRNLYSSICIGTYLPVVLDDCVRLEMMTTLDPALAPLKVVHEGTAGVFITLNRNQCEMVYDIPETMKVWFGDNWIYGMLRGCGHQTIIPENLVAFHGLSQTVSRVEGIDEIIAVDRYEWYNKVQHYLNELIAKYNDSKGIPIYPYTDL